MFTLKELQMIKVMLNCMEDNLVDHQGFQSEDVLELKRKIKINIYSKESNSK